jgi:hypothetical protein
VTPRQKTRGCAAILSRLGDLPSGDRHAVAIDVAVAPVVEECRVEALSARGVAALLGDLREKEVRADVRDHVEHALMPVRDLLEPQGRLPLLPGSECALAVVRLRAARVAASRPASA